MYSPLATPFKCDITSYLSVEHKNFNFLTFWMDSHMRAVRLLYVIFIYVLKYTWQGHDQKQSGAIVSLCLALSPFPYSTSN